MAMISNSTVTLVELKRSLVPTTWENSVRVLGLSECKQAALSLAHAFATDEYARYLCDVPDMEHMSPEDKWHLHVDMMTYIVLAHYYNGLVTAIGSEYDSVALW
jgi:hypothetical protein